MEPSRTQRPRVDSSEEKIPLYLKLTKTVDCKVKPNETVKKFKTLLYEKGIVPENIECIFFGGKLLKDGERLVDHGIQRDCTLSLTLGRNLGLKLLVKLPSPQRNLVVEAKAHDTVQSIKSLIEVKEGIKSDQFSLIYEGKLLEEDRTLISHDVKNESAISVAFYQKDVLSIYVKALTGEVAKLKVKVRFSVADVKAIAESILGTSGGSLFYSGQQLEESKIIACYDIKEGSMLEILYPVFQIFIKPWSGRTIVLDVQKCTTVEDVKDKIFKRLKIPVHRQRVIFAGIQLEEERDLGSYGIEEHRTLFMV